MKIKHAVLAAVLLGLAAVTSCSGTTAGTTQQTPEMETQQPDTSSARVEMETTAGNITVLLYGDTPRHRDNFLKLVKDGYYNGTLFHRVIKDFMIQAGDPDSRTAPAGASLGSGGPGYTIDAEIVFPKHFHKRGALAAARQSDQVNPMRKSSGSQFYIVTGTVLDSAGVEQMERHMVQSRIQSEFNRLAMEQIDSIRAMQSRGDRKGLEALQDSLIARAQAAAGNDAPAMTDEMRTAYTSCGGAPHLDGDYTVFGEIVDGMDVIEKIENMPTDRRNRPTEDVRILGMKVLPNR